MQKKNKKTKVNLFERELQELKLSFTQFFITDDIQGGSVHSFCMRSYAKEYHNLHFDILYALALLQCASYYGKRVYSFNNAELCVFKAEFQIFYC